jgi:hypothetical protein
MTYLCYLCLFGSSLPPVVCRRAHFLFMLFVFVCAILQNFDLVLGDFSVIFTYLYYLCLFGSSLPPTNNWR